MCLFRCAVPECCFGAAGPVCLAGGQNGRGAFGLPVSDGGAAAHFGEGAKTGRIRLYRVYIRWAFLCGGYRLQAVLSRASVSVSATVRSVCCRFASASSSQKRRPSADAACGSGKAVRVVAAAVSGASACVAAGDVPGPAGVAASGVVADVVEAAGGADSDGVAAFVPIVFVMAGVAVVAAVARTGEPSPSLPQAQCSTGCFAFHTSTSCCASSIVIAVRLSQFCARRLRRAVFVRFSCGCRPLAFRCG